jgi:hypothetical protein
MFYNVVVLMHDNIEPYDPEEDEICSSSTLVSLQLAAKHPLSG